MNLNHCTPRRVRYFARRKRQGLAIPKFAKNVAEAIRQAVKHYDKKEKAVKLAGPGQRVELTATKSGPGRRAGHGNGRGQRSWPAGFGNRRFKPLGGAK